MIRVMLFDRFDRPIGELAEGEVFAITRREAVNGEHSLTITTTRVLEQGWRVLTRDARGKWREHVVYGTDALHGSGERPLGDYYCVWSLQADLMGTRVSRMPGTQTPVPAAAALDDALSGTARWQVGTVTNTNTGGASMYDTDGWSAMGVLVAEWGGEVDVTIEVGNDGVTARKADYYAKQGDQEAKRRYDFGADIRSVRRRIADGPLYCRITPRGRGEETEGGGYGRKITIEDVNGGKDYLENAGMVDLAKLPDGSGGWEYPTLEVENPDCETPAELKAWGEGILEESTTPKITYEVDVMQLALEGTDMHGVSLGDAVQVVDRKFGSGLRVSGRVLETAVNLLDELDMQITVGNIADDLASMMGGFDARLAEVRSTVQAINGGTMSTADYLGRLLDRLNAEINGEGGYAYITQGQGIRTYDAAVSDPLVGAEASKAVEIKGGTIRIANSKTAQGAWEWKTVFTAGHIAAGLVTAANITAGFIGSAASGNYWNLDTGELTMAATTAVGSTTMQDIIEAANSTITDVDVEYAQNQSESTAPTSGWSTTAPTWREGYYIWQRTKTVSGGGVDYSDPTCISGKDGTSVTVTSIQYGTSDSASTQPSSWSGTAPTSIAKGKWLWVKTTYSNGSTSTTKSYVGTDGTSVTILGSYDTLAELQAAHPTGSLGDGYIVAGDLYVWSGTAWENVGTIQGPQGATGAPGTSVTVTSIQYGTSNSASTQPSSWSTTAPTSIEQGKWLWVKTNFSNGSSAVNKSYTGVDGEKATVYSITASVDAIVRAQGGTISPASVTFTAKSKSGNDAEAAYAGRIRVQTSTDGSTWTNRYNSSSNESSYAYTPTSAIASSAKYIRGILFAAGGTTTQLDAQTVAIVSDGTNGTNGTNGTDGKDAYTVVLSNESHTFAGDSEKAIPDSTTCQVIAYKGATRIAATIGTITGKPTGMSTSISSNGTTSASVTVSVTASMTTRNGVLTIPLTIDGKSFTATFSYALALVGATGATGATGKGVSAVEEQYYLSTSSTTQTGGYWSTNQPTWESGKYIWTRSKVTWTEGSPTTTTPVLAKAVNSANQNAAAAQTAVTSLDNSLNQQGIFNRLTNNGQTQGIYLENGKVYINGEYIKSGALVVKDASDNVLFEANIANPAVQVGGFDVSTDAISTDYMELANRGLRFFYPETYYLTSGRCGGIFSCVLGSGTSRGLMLALDSQSDFFRFDVGADTSGTGVGTPIIVYCGDSVYYSAWRQNALTIDTDVMLQATTNLYVRSGGYDYAGITGTYAVGDKHIVVRKGIITNIY